jgi:hypothetical protein
MGFFAEALSLERSAEKCFFFWRVRLDLIAFRCREPIRLRRDRIFCRLLVPAWAEPAHVNTRVYGSATSTAKYWFKTGQRRFGFILAQYSRNQIIRKD